MKGLYVKPTQSQAAIQIAAWHKLHQNTSEMKAEKKSYSHMIYRCCNENCHNYSIYGGRGIKVCERWLDKTPVKIGEYTVKRKGCTAKRGRYIGRGLLNFLNDMGCKPSPDCTIDRINNDGDYCPENCRWASRAVQARNRRSVKNITFNGKTQTATEWARELHINRSTITERIRHYGWSEPEMILSKPRERRMV